MKESEALEIVSHQVSNALNPFIRVGRYVFSLEKIERVELEPGNARVVLAQPGINGVKPAFDFTGEEADSLHTFFDAAATNLIGLHRIVGR